MANVTERANNISFGVSGQTDKVMPSEVIDPAPPGQCSMYRVSVMQRSQRGALVDRGANGGILGNDARVIWTHGREVDVTGIDNHELNALKLVDAVAKVTTQLGEAIIIMRQYAYHGLQRTIHSSAQIEHYKNVVHDRSMRVGGTQHIRTVCGYILPLDIINALPYLPQKPPTDDELIKLPHIILTCRAPWDPKCVDFLLTTRDDWYNTLKDYDEGLIKTPFDQYPW